MPRLSITQEQATNQVLNTITVSATSEILKKTLRDRVLDSILISVSTNAKVTVTQRFYPEALAAIATSRNGTWVAGGQNSGKIYRSTDDGMTWQQVVDTSKNRIIAIGHDGTNWIAGALIGGGNYYLYRSTNDGATWALVHTEVALGAGYEIAGSGGSFLACVNNKIVRSADSGATWATAYTAATGDISIVDIEPGNGGSCLAVGNSGRVYRSTDSGANWSHVATLAISAADGIASMLDTQTWCMAIYDGNPKIYRSTDDGATWSLVYTGTAGDRIRGIACDDVGAWCGVTQSGKVVRSSDNGATWAVAYSMPLVSNVLEPLDHIECDWMDRFVVVGDNGIYRSVDNGVDWSAGAGAWSAYLAAYAPLVYQVEAVLRASHALDVHTAVATACTLIGRN